MYKFIKNYIISFLFLGLLFNISAQAQSNNKNEFYINSLKNDNSGRTVKAVLKLKTVDYNFMFIEFYDADNIDLRLDLAEYYKKKKYKTYRKMDNIHLGAMYYVEFKIRSIDKKTGSIDAELIDYLPYFLERLP